MFLDWYISEKLDMSAKGYPWKTLADLKLEIWKMNRSSSYESMYKKLHMSFKNVQEITHAHLDDLFEKKKYK